MPEVSPRVYIVGHTVIDRDGMEAYLRELGTSWRPPAGATDAEAMVEFYGRLCYRSFEVGLNPNVSRVRTDHAEYIENLLSSGHGSVFEAVTVNFVISNVSRVFTHELVRHRVGTHISQESMRYVRYSDGLPYWVPRCIAEDPWALEFFREKWRIMEGWQRELAEHFRIDEEVNFSRKKELTSAFRRLIGEGVATTIGWSANFRTLRHVIELRTAPGVEEEFALVAGEILRACRERWATSYRDFEEVDVPGREWPAYVPRWRKV
jgi:thymidylate synthase (FAD)